MTLIKKGIEISVTLAIIELSVKKLQPNTNSKLLILILFMTYSRGKASYYILRFCFFVLITTFSKSAFSQTCPGFQVSIGGLLADKAYDVAATTNNDFFIAGTTRTQSGGDDILLVKINSGGNIIWSSQYGGAGDESVRKISPTADGGILVIGQTKSYLNSRGDIFCMKANNNGTVLWTRKFGIGSAHGDLGMDVIETTDGYVLSGILDVVGGSADAVIIKLDNSANFVWSKRFDHLDGDDGVGILQKGDTLVTAIDLQNSYGNYSLAISKLKLSDGSFISAKKLTPATRGLFNPYLTRSPDNKGYFISGHSIDNDDYTNMKHSIIRLNENLDVINTKTISIAPVTNNFYTGFSPLPDGSFITCASPQTNADGYVYRIADNGSINYSAKINKLEELKLYRTAVSGTLGVAVGSVVQNGQEDFFVTGFDINKGLTSCDVENVNAGIEKPVFSSDIYTWPKITNQSFSDVMLSFNATVMTLESKNLCTNETLSFNYSQDVCSPNIIHFSSSLTSSQSFLWEFGDGQTNKTDLNPSHTFTNYKMYTVKLSLTDGAGCLESASKIIPVQLNWSDIVITADTTICAGDSVQLRTKDDGLEFCWKPLIGLSSSTIANPIAKPTNTTTYTFTSKTTGTNLVTNADFSEGNSGFSSDYTYSGSGLPAAVYTVGPNPTTWHPAMPSCNDHTSGTGNMMMVNGSEQLNSVVWTQNLPVVPNSNYVFSIWLETITTINPAQLQFSINGVPLGNVFSADDRSCVWKQFYSTWSSGNNTSATISIVNMNQVYSGNDFAIDDIFFGETIIKTDSVRVTVASLPDLNIGRDISLCKGASVELKANIDVSSSISWSPATFLNNPNIANPVTTASQDISYIATQRNGAGCTKKDTVAIKVINPPTIKLPADTAVCKGIPFIITSNSTNTVTYNWEPSRGLSNTTSSAPSATPDSTMLYKVIASNAACSATDSILLTIKPSPNITISNDTSICGSSKVQLIASGATTYQWIPSSGLSSSTIANPIASPTITTKYIVSASADNGCSNTDSVSITVVPKPVFGVDPFDQTICLNDSATLTAAGGDIYHWKLAGATTTPLSNVIKVSPLVTTEYKVYIRNSVCNLEDSAIAMVNVKPLPDVSISKSNDIDCSNISSQLLVTGGTSYDWSPVISLSSGSIYNPIASPDQTTTYSVIAKSSDGCRTKDSITVKVASIGGSNIYMPTAFTPNGDGKNDCFGIKNIGRVSNFALKIYNRWGENVFSTNNPSECWNGSYKGTIQDTGAFVYYLKVKTFCGEVFKKGTITLIR